MGLRVPEVVLLTLVVVGTVFFFLPAPTPEAEFAASLTSYLKVHPPSHSRVAISWNGLSSPSPSRSSLSSSLDLFLLFVIHSSFI